jgi:hypothetical protein
MLFFAWLACFTYGSVQRAETLGKGNREIGVELGAVGIYDENALVGFPNPSFSARFGVSDRVDLGGRMGLSMLAVTGKVMLSKPGADGLKLSLAPEAAMLPWVNWVAHAQVPLLIGVPLGSRSELIFGPRAHVYGVAAVGEGAASAVFAGSSFGFSHDLGGVVLLPELTLEYPLQASASFGGDTAVESLIGRGGMLFNFQVGLLFGHRRAAGDTAAQPPAN